MSGRTGDGREPRAHAARAPWVAGLSNRPVTGPDRRPPWSAVHRTPAGLPVTVPAGPVEEPVTQAVAPEPALPVPASERSPGPPVPPPAATWSPPEAPSVPAPRSPSVTGQWEPVGVAGTAPASSPSAWQAPDPPLPARQEPPQGSRDSRGGGGGAVDILPRPAGDGDGTWAGPPASGRGRHAAPGHRGIRVTAAVVLLACAATAMITAAVVGRSATGDTGASPVTAVERAVTIPGPGAPPRRGQPAAEPDGTAVVDLVAGTCFVDPAPGDGADDRLTTVACDTAHDNEVVAVFTLDDGPWPGTATVAAQAQRRCQAEGAAVVEAGPEPSAWGFFAFHPTRAAWTSGDRSVQCVAYPLRGGPKTGALTN